MLFLRYSVGIRISCVTSANKHYNQHEITLSLSARPRQILQKESAESLPCSCNGGGHPIWLYHLRLYHLLFITNAWAVSRWVDAETASPIAVADPETWPPSSAARRSSSYSSSFFSENTDLLKLQVSRSTSVKMDPTETMVARGDLQLRQPLCGERAFPRGCMFADVCVWAGSSGRCCITSSKELRKSCILAKC